MNNKKGFTLIEMLVAVGLFSVVMLISTAVIFSIVNGNRKSQTINTVVNNLNFSIESVIRDIKTGYWYQCHDYGGGLASLTIEEFKSHYLNSDYLCSSNAPSKYISFISTLSSDGTPRIVEYYFQDANGTSPGRIYKVDKDTVGSGDLLTSPDIDIKQFDLYIKNPPPSNAGSGSQPGVFLIMKGNVKVGNKDSDVSAFGVQTYMTKHITKIKGFTLVETLVAISILVLALTGPLAIIAQSLKASYFSRDEITAAYLAQEPIEFIRNMRDQNTLRSADASFWLTGPSGGSSTGPENLVNDLNSNHLISDPGGNPIKTKLVWGAGSFHLETCVDCHVTYDSTAGVGQNKVMYGNNDNTLPNSIFTREVYLIKGNTDPSANGVSPERELIVKVVVSWTTAGVSHNVTVSERLFNWQLEK